MNDKSKSQIENELWPERERESLETIETDQNPKDMNVISTPTDSTIPQSEYEWEITVRPIGRIVRKDLSFRLDLDAFFDSLFSDCTFMVRPQYHYVPEENPWADFGRAYFHPYQFDPERFEVNLYTVDEMRRQIEAYESNMTCLPSFAVIDSRNPVSVEGRAVEEECLLVGDSCVSLQCLKGMALETPYYENVIDNWNDGWKASIPYIKFTSLHCLALCGERQSPEAVAASRRRCRSFLAAQADEKPSDDLLGH